ncbi:MAG: methylated-DNA--[protein]-cysteine S-methyltransferase [Gemmatimonadaceae bacterium]
MTHAPAVEDSRLADYERVERAIGYLDRHHRTQPSLAEVAASVGLSEFHFQRLFLRWAGISPKRFVQFLSADYARRLLRESRNVLETSYEAGLSGPGRLHDLLVTVDAVTPGEVRSRGETLSILHGFHETPFGECLIAVTARGVCGLYFVQHGDRAAAAQLLEREWPEADRREDARFTAGYVERIFAPGGLAAGVGDDPLGVLVKGTNFQIKVWEALLRIPPGELVTYEDLAAAVGQPGASRAVGNAVGSNPISYLIPCHRVIRKTGAFGNYGGGPLRKRAMLGWEAARRSGE